jgi:hypothetical protein
MRKATTNTASMSTPMLMIAGISPPKVMSPNTTASRMVAASTSRPATTTIT